MVVYLDLIFLLNLLIDGATLQTTAWSRKIKANPWRILAAATIGACYVLMMFAPALAFAFTFVIKCLFSLIMLYTAFGFGSLQYFLRNLSVFYLVNFAAAGSIFAVNYYLQSSHDVLNGMVFTQTGGLSFELKVGGLVILVLFPACIILYRKVMNAGKRKEIITDYLVETQVFIDERVACCHGLIDTGNQLYDPLTKMPVMIMEASYWRDVLPVRWLKLMQSGDTDGLLQTIGIEPFIWQDRLRIIPYKGVDKGSQFLLALKPDKVVIIQGETIVETQKVWIGLSGSKLSHDGTYEAIIHPTLMNTLGR